MSDGQVVEFGQPYELLCDKAGVLTELAEQTGAASKDRLLEIARAAYFMKTNKEDASLEGIQKVESESMFTEDVAAPI